jgi:hypothetical protein
VAELPEAKVHGQAIVSTRFKYDTKIETPNVRHPQKLSSRNQYWSMWQSGGRSRPEGQVPRVFGLHQRYIEEASFCMRSRCNNGPKHRSMTMPTFERTTTPWSYNSTLPAAGIFVSQLLGDSAASPPTRSYCYDNHNHLPSDVNSDNPKRKRDA